VLLVAMRSKRRKYRLWRIPVWLLTLWACTQGFANVMGYVDWNKADSLRTDALLARMKSAGGESDASALPIGDFRGLIRINAKNQALLEDVPEYRPLVRSSSDFPPRTFARVEWQYGDGVVRNVRWEPGRRRRFSVESATGGRLLVRTTAWPGWQINVNGESRVANVAGDWGRIVVPVASGHSDVDIVYRGTENQRLGEAISMLVLALLVAYGATAFIFRLLAQPRSSSVVTSTSAGLP
jgi:hypothetical protein